jgi:hypothetical protein
MPLPVQLDTLFSKELREAAVAIAIMETTDKDTNAITGLEIRLFIPAELFDKLPATFVAEYTKVVHKAPAERNVN